VAGRALMIAALSVGGIGWALPSFAQEVSIVKPVRGPSRYIVPASILPVGTGITSLNLRANLVAPPAPSGPGLGGNAVSLSNHSAWSDLFQLSTGITTSAAPPWQGRLDLAGKLGLMQEKLGSLASVAGIARVALNVNANGVPSPAFTLGIPIEKTLSFASMNRLTVTAYPNWGTDLVSPGAGLSPPTRFALGLGGAVALSDTLALIADTSFVTGPTLLNEGSDLGVRFGLSPSVAFDLSVGLSASAPSGSRPISVGTGMSWFY